MFTVRRLQSLSWLRKQNLQRRLLERCERAETYHGTDSPEHKRALAVLGRFAAITA